MHIRTTVSKWDLCVKLLKVWNELWTPLLTSVLKIKATPFKAETNTKPFPNGLTAWQSRQASILLYLLALNRRYQRYFNVSQAELVNQITKERGRAPLDEGIYGRLSLSDWRTLETHQPTPIYYQLPGSKMAEIRTGDHASNPSWFTPKRCSSMPFFTR